VTSLKGYIRHDHGKSTTDPCTIKLAFVAAPSIKYTYNIIIYNLENHTRFLVCENPIKKTLHNDNLPTINSTMVNSAVEQ